VAVVVGAEWNEKSKQLRKKKEKKFVSIHHTPLVPSARSLLNE